MADDRPMMTLGNMYDRQLRKRRAGVVLILVTVVIVMLSLAGLSFVATLSTEHKAIELHGDELRLQQLVESGVELMATFAEQSAQMQRTAGGADDNPDLFRAVNVFEDERAARHGRVTLVSPRWDDEEIAGVCYGLEDESGRLNLAVLPEWERQRPGAGQHALMCLPGMTEAVATKIMDRLNAAASFQSGSGKREPYADLHVPHTASNGCLARIEELLLIPDVPRGLLMGRDLNLDYQLSGHETGDRAERIGSRLSGTGVPWALLLTAYSAERNVNPRRQPRVALNNLDLRDLFVRLSAVVDPAWAEFIVLYRQFGPSQATAPRASLAASPGAGATSANTGRKPEEIAAGLDFNRPGSFRIESSLDLIGAHVVLPPAPGPPQPPRIVESPFSEDLAAMREYLPKLLEQTTLTPDAAICGRININTASRAVLRGIPGADDRLVEAITSNRNAAADETPRRYPTWLLTEGLVDLPQMKALLPYITCGGHVYRAQVIGYFEEGGPVARAEVVVDATTTPPQPVLWTDLRVRGRGFSPEDL